MSATRSRRSPQVFRAVYQDAESGTITPLSKTVNIKPRLEAKSGENVILWNDIKMVFKNPLHVRHEDTVVPYLTDDNLAFLQPLRIPVFPGDILDVVIEYPVINPSIESLRINPSIESLRINPSIESLRNKDSPTASSTSPINLSNRTSTDMEPTASTVTPPITTSNVSLNSQVKRGPEDRGEPLKSSASPISVSIGRAPQFIPNYNDHSNDFYNHTQPDVEHTSDIFSGDRQEDAQEDEVRDMNENYERGRAFYDGKGVLQDYSKAMKCFLRAAIQGHIISQCYLGYMYEKGKSIQQNYPKAIEWYEKAASQGNIAAQHNLGAIYNNGDGVTQDYFKAIAWYQMAAIQGHATAQFQLGFMHHQGYGVTQDYSKAFEWYQKAASQGDADAQRNLGLMYNNGYGVTRDYLKAVEWYQKAAIQGHSAAQIQLGFMYHNGHGVIQDYSKAAEWYQKAASQGDYRAQRSQLI
ncbi:hypothetical protein BGX27_000365 [Mortierella sp. AM989]|nr:hypothetical protein BGX27_000365 [Mortierella sp. AM989]